MNLAPPIPRFGRPLADPEAREREKVKRDAAAANQNTDQGPDATPSSASDMRPTT